MHISRWMHDALFLKAITLRLGTRHSSIYTLCIVSPLLKHRTNGLTLHKTISCICNTNNKGSNISQRTTVRKLSSVYCHVQGVCVTKLTGSSSDDWIYQHFGYTISFNYS
jgi:hypothetical protein